jgi:hypothetical protein
MKAALPMTAILLATLTLSAQSGDNTKTTGRACLSVLNTANGDEEPLLADHTGRRGLKLLAHFDATVPCEVFAAVFGKNGEAIPGCRPQFASVAAHTEGTLPKAPASWNWEKDGGPVEGYILFFAKGSKDASEFRALATAMQSAKDESVIKLQTAKVRELIGRVAIDRSPPRPPKLDADVAGTYRMVVGFEWRNAAKSVSFSAAKPVAAVFPTR